MKMKVLRNLFILAVTILAASGCNEWIDPISYVAPGQDENAPVITISYPQEGTSLQVPELVTSVNIKFEVTDDIELKSVSVMIDGTEITSYDEFIDYRRAVKEYLYSNVTNGAHTLTIEAVDMDDKTSVAEVHFEKKPPYTPLYDGEVFYMPFDGDYVEKISFVAATPVGTPGFAGTALKGLNAYQGAASSYLTFPATAFQSSEFSGAFWYKVNPTPDRAGILNASVTGEDRKYGFRLFREGNATSQRIKLNVGTGTGETWNDGNMIVAPGTEWVHIAFTVSATNVIIYLDGQVAATVAGAGINWTGCNSLTIGSGAPNFIYWNHGADLSQIDELRLFDKALSQSEIQTIIADDSPYVPKYSGEVFYMPFEGNYREMVSGDEATEAGTPDFAAGLLGQSYSGAADSYISFPTEEIATGEFSGVFWYKVNIGAGPSYRAGMINASLTGENRSFGFRLFREGDATSQRIKINVGSGTGETWNDGGLIAADGAEWVHVAFTISATKCAIYLNGALATEVDASGINWTGCDALSIGSGAPNFLYWGHVADLSQFDELRFFNKALTLTEIQAIIADED